MRVRRIKSNDRRRAYRAALGVAAAVTVGSLLAACEVDTGLYFINQNVPDSSCYYGRSQAFAPGPGGHDVDYKAFIYKKQRTVDCAPTHSGKSFFTNESSVRASLYRSSDFGLCAQTGFATTPSGETSWGIGQAWSKSGACANTQVFVTRAGGYWNLPAGLTYTGTPSDAIQF